jgi:hypothetical protein
MTEAPKGGYVAALSISICTLVSERDFAVKTRLEFNALTAETGVSHYQLSRGFKRI